MKPMMEDMRATLSIRVRDVATATLWYERVFGVEPIYQGIDRSLDGKAEAISCFRLGGIKIWLSKMPVDRVRQTSGNDLGATIAFMTRAPLAPLRRQLIERGAEVRADEIKQDFPEDESGIRQGKDAEFFYVYDPDGNRFEFCRLHK
jgi:catechol 2,3-dioxygenase-like lactoylglutathione lyase family enzyme